MYRIEAAQDGNTQTGLFHSLVLDHVVILGTRAPVQKRTYHGTDLLHGCLHIVRIHVFPVCPLGDLVDLLLQSHLREQVLHPLLHRRRRILIHISACARHRKDAARQH